jgi:hypothetical protein
MYASVTNIIPDLDDHSKISGRILYITIDSHGFLLFCFFIALKFFLPIECLSFRFNAAC